MTSHYLDGAKHAKHTSDLTGVEVESRADAVERLRGFADAVGMTGLTFPSPGVLDPATIWEQANSSNAMRALFDYAGFSWASPHAFRRTAITWLGESGIPLAQVADFTGHADPNMTVSVYLARDFEGDKSSLAGIL